MQKFGEPRDFYKEKPVSDAIFQVYREQFSYDKSQLNARMEARRDSSQGWIHERMTFDAVYGKERIIAHLFLPRTHRPPIRLSSMSPAVGLCFNHPAKTLKTILNFRSSFPFL